MKKLRYILLLSMSLISILAHAQQQREWESYFIELTDAEDYDEEALSEKYDLLTELEENPLNINTATYDDFCNIPGLSISQISDIIEFRDKYGYLKTMEELAMVTSIDRTLRLFLSYFFYAGKKEYPKWYSKEGMKNLKNQHEGTLIGSVDIPFYTREGYKTSDETGEKAYLGDKYRYNLRYTDRFSNAIRYGLVMAKDAGEPVFSRGNSDGMDYYSYFVSLHNLGKMKQLILGNYRLRFGMGLVLNTNSSYGKQSMLTSVSTMSNQLTGHTSRSEANYLRGAAATIALGKAESANLFDFTVFYSTRSVDATLNDDGSVSTILTSGYHRTKLEMDKKHNTQQVATGGHLSWRNGGWHAGVTAVYDWYNRDLNPSYSTEGYKYRKYAARGNSFWNAGVDYGYISSRFSFTGETATGGCGAIATLNAVQAKVGDDVVLTAIQRFYSYKYFALQSNSFSDGGKVQNESGFYLGCRWNVGKYAVMDVYSDVSYSPWLKYQVHSSSYSLDNSATMTYNMGEWSFLGRYRMRMKQRDNADKTALFNRFEHRGRLSATRNGTALSFKTQADLSVISPEGTESFGWMLSETVQYKFRKAVNASLGAAYFHTSDYDSRIYSYEKSLLYSFSMPSFYGEGMRLFGVLRADISNSWMLMGKLGWTRYFDRKTIGTAHQMINSSHQVDFSVQLRCKF